jgi:hypothetical protein
VIPPPARPRTCRPPPPGSAPRQPQPEGQRPLLASPPPRATPCPIAENLAELATVPEADGTDHSGRSASHLSEPNHSGKSDPLPRNRITREYPSGGGALDPLLLGRAREVHALEIVDEQELRGKVLGDQLQPELPEHRVLPEIPESRNVRDTPS